MNSYHDVYIYGENLRINIVPVICSYMYLAIYRVVVHVSGYMSILIYFYPAHCIRIDFHDLIDPVNII